MLSKSFCFTSRSQLGHTCPMKQAPKWKFKFNQFLTECQSELVKTTTIGKKMITAGKTNSTLHETYEEIGRIVEKMVEKGEMEIDHPRIRALLSTAKACRKDLEEIEKQVNKIKFSSGPEDLATSRNRSSKEEN